MAQRPVQRGTTVLDPMFAIPEGTDEFVYDEREVDFTAEDEGDNDEFGDIIDIIVDDESTLSTPIIQGIIPPQVVRRTLGGQNVIDVVMDVEADDGVEFEMRVTKI